VPKIAVCLSGCGLFDGTEIQEAVLTLLALDQAGAEAICCAPDAPQAKVVDHVSHKPVGERRGILAESARISRGKIVAVDKVRARDIDGLIFPGGYGAALNLCTFAVDGAECSVDPDVETLAADMLEMKKPIGAICIAPAMLARILGKRKIAAQVTIGKDPGTAAAVRAMGAVHCDCAVTDAVTDHQYKVVTTPAYMLGQGPAEVFEGIRKCVAEVLRLCNA
jgi:enhancing lycopene biosynthesis protein 2